jgi:phosphoenolpyruvate carboxykinase (ATP)
MIDAIHNGGFETIGFSKDPQFGFDIPLECIGVPNAILEPKNTWEDKHAYDATKSKLISLFTENFKQYEAGVNTEIIASGPTR